MKGWLKMLGGIAVASLAHAGVAGFLAEHDVIAALLVQRSVSAIVLVALLLVLRVCLIVLAPVLVLWRLVTQISSTVPDKIG